MDGSVNMRIPAQATTSYGDVTDTTTSYLDILSPATTSFSDIDHPSFGSLLCENRNELLQEHGSNILVGEELFYNNVTYT